MANELRIPHLSMNYLKSKSDLPSQSYPQVDSVRDELRGKAHTEHHLVHALGASPDSDKIDMVDKASPRMGSVVARVLWPM